MSKPLKVLSTPRHEFEEAANQLLADGWRLHGEPATTMEDGVPTITQVFIRQNAVLAAYEETRDFLGEVGGDA